MVNIWTTPDFREPFCTIKINSINYSKTIKTIFLLIIRADLINGLRYYHINLLQLHLIYLYIMRDG